MEIREPSMSTMLMNFENKFDPYSAMNTPLYQTATFKQVLFVADEGVVANFFEVIISLIISVRGQIQEAGICYV